MFGCVEVVPDFLHCTSAGAIAGLAAAVLFAVVTAADVPPIFVVCGLACVTAWAIIHLLAPRHEPARLTSSRHDDLL
jgi:hypothetical protein